MWQRPLTSSVRPRLFFCLCEVVRRIACLLSLQRLCFVHSLPGLRLFALRACASGRALAVRTSLHCAEAIRSPASFHRGLARIWAQATSARPCLPPFVAGFFLFSSIPACRRLTIRSSGPLRWAALSSYALWQRPLTSSVRPRL